MNAQGKKSTLRAARSLLYRHGVRVLRTTQFFQASCLLCFNASEVLHATALPSGSSFQLHRQRQALCHRRSTVLSHSPSFVCAGQDVPLGPGLELCGGSSSRLQAPAALPSRRRCGGRCGRWRQRRCGGGRGGGAAAAAQAELASACSSSRRACSAGRDSAVPAAGGRAVQS